MSIRQSVVAGSFYPQDAQTIETMIEKYSKPIRHTIQNTPITDVKAIIVPHAGYIYSGFTANTAFAIASRTDIENVVVIGPSHRVAFQGSSVALFDSYATPLGELPINKKLSQELIDGFGLDFYPDAHIEHSTEVQMPFIKHYFPNASVVEIVYSDEEALKMSEIIVSLSKHPKTLVVISTDLSHYYNLSIANQLDGVCIEAIVVLSEEKLYNKCKACGKIGVAGVLLAARKLHLKSAILDYRTSADASKDTSQVVGYLSAAFF
jgi:MEMO1 family protein